MSSLVQVHGLRWPLRTVVPWPHQIWGLWLIQQLTSLGVVQTPRTD